MRSRCFVGAVLVSLIVLPACGPRLPTSADEIPKPRTYLVISSPTGGKTASLTTVVVGETAPHAYVFSRETTTKADAKGRFALMVPLKRGLNTIPITAVTTITAPNTQEAGIIRLNRGLMRANELLNEKQRRAVALAVYEISDHMTSDMRNAFARGHWQTAVQEAEVEADVEIAKLRKDYGITQEQLAAILDEARQRNWMPT